MAPETAYHLERLTDAEIFAEMNRVATQFSGVAAHQCELAKRDAKRIRDGLDALTAAVHEATVESEKLSKVGIRLNWALVAATIVGAFATGVGAYAAFRH